jgi:NAD(P)-dependent dehydrogenase (short-subunit alcohol dehydrogenase family)
MNRWTTADLPDLTGRTVLVTGATSGLGEASVRALARTGARVLMTARDTARGRAVAPDGVEVVELDLADLSSVRKAAAEVRERTGDRLDVLMNNAGVMGTPYLRTVDGFELQIGTNHLGHAALTWLLMPALRAAGTADRPSRVVVLASLAHQGGSLDLDDLNWERRAYRPDRAYSASKLADLLFAAELDRRLRADEHPAARQLAAPAWPARRDARRAVQRADDPERRARGTSPAQRRVRRRREGRGLHRPRRSGRDPGLPRARPAECRRAGPGNRAVPLGGNGRSHVGPARSRRVACTA